MHNSIQASEEMRDVRDLSRRRAFLRNSCRRALARSPGSTARKEGVANARRLRRRCKLAEERKPHAQRKPGALRLQKYMFSGWLKKLVLG